MNSRRTFVIAIGAAVGALSREASPQSVKGSSRRVGVLAPSTAAREEVTLGPFFDQMHRLGWVDGQTVEYDRAYADDQQQQLPTLAAALVARQPDIIYAPPTPAAIAAKRATNTIPIVFGAVWDPVGSGLVSSLASPGGNVTGVCVFAESLAPKRLQLMREILPNLKRIGWLGDATDPTTAFDRQALVPAAREFGIQILTAEAANPEDAEKAIQQLIDQHVNAIYTGTSPLLYNVRTALIERANRARIPVIAYRAQLAEAGALFSYGTSLPEQIRRSALFVDKILRGAKPSDLPVEQATAFETLNTRTARMLRIEIPKMILLRADKIIE